MNLYLKYSTMGNKILELIRNEIMKEIFSIVVVFLVLFIAVPAFSSCPREEKAVVAGAACSIDELNSVDRNGNLRENSKIVVVKERNLRPVKIHKEISPIEESGCFWGRCLSKQIFNK